MSRISAGIVQLIYVYVVINTRSFLPNDSTDELLCNTTYHSSGGVMPFILEGMFTVYVGRGIRLKENGIGW